MNISQLFIRRPIMTTLVMVGVLIFGLMSYQQLPVSDLPNVDYPTLQVTANLPGASPETMASSVATPLEQQFSSIAGLSSMNSTSSLGSAQITLQFDLNRDIDGAAQDVQSAISKAARQLPTNMPNPPSFRKVNPADQPVLYISLNSSILPLSTVDKYAETLLAQRLSMVDGVAQVQVYGSQKYAVRIQLDPESLSAKGIGIDEVADAIANGNVNLPTGTLYGQQQNYTIQANGQLNDAASYRSLTVTYQNGAPVQLSELGQVLDSVENDKIASWYFPTKQGNKEQKIGQMGTGGNKKNNSQLLTPNSSLSTPHTQIQNPGVRAIVLAIQRQPGTNTVEVVDAIKKLLPTFQKQIPAAVNMNILYDRSQSIRESVDDVQFTLLLTIALVVLVIFLFLRNISATVIPSLAVPLSIVATFAVMLLLGYSLDNLSLMALTLSVGFVVDDAVVMLENIVRHMEMGESRLEAALNGSREIGFTILSMTISLVAVFIPILFMEGILGRLFREFAVTISVAILVSGVISLSLTPMLCSRFLRPPHHQGNEGDGEMGRWGDGEAGGAGGETPDAQIQNPKSKIQNFQTRLYNISESFFDLLLRGYDWSLKISLKYHRTTMVISGAILVATIYLFIVVPKGFVPNADVGQITATTQASEDISFDEMVKHQQAVAAIAYRDPNVDSINSSVGAGGPNASANSGRLLIELKPRHERHLSADEIVEELRPKLSSVPGIKVFLQNPPAINIGGQQTKAQYQFTLQSPNIQELYQYAPLLENQLRNLSELQDVNSDLQIKNPQVKVDINRDQASALGLTVNQIETALSNAYGTRQVSTIYASDSQYQVIMGVEPKYQQNSQALDLLSIRAPNGQLVPLNAVATLTKDVGPLTINHKGQLASVTFSFNLKPGISLSNVTGKIEQISRQILPATISTGFQGSAQAFQSSIQGLGILLLVAIFVIYIVLGILYENFIHPLTILSSLPSAGFGALLTLLIFDVDLNIYAFVGIILLVGIVKKNGIMMVDFAIEARQEGKTPYDAIYQACLVRFRPIMMTTMAALMGTLPIALGLGAGADTRRPLGLAVVGGLVFSQFLTLYLTPVFYTYMESWQTNLRKYNWQKHQLQKEEQIGKTD
ncbi:acriflavine resistance protein B [Nostoc linckia z18]|uniref:Acriflavine resistance protein B n=5 Tax=Nostoc linckia TaxID=92942 RepID=A0A9Q5Z6N0_NOSLI|nr:efflux RND transporter permease subunit [Nostoc linckia]PHK42589.1 acriflavine resistance protein B [Nostoc linckia z16]PHJ62143.1 acriflavine resistance protein B [Nostoc linckia z1]PHJ71974.1 acriflavine resistance protein B [Nostoc linckia z3]PHJ77942.1 acriflavine resistance protein B [Nostoc linckia z2]PHJ81397.1 acriflavine resistance protein B [Nostoc linckia z6]